MRFSAVYIFFLAAILTWVSSGQAGRALTINLTFDSTVTNLPNAAQYEAACNYTALQLESLFTDNITVNITVQAVTGTSVFGESETSQTGPYTYTEVVNALSANATTANDASAVASLPTADPTSGGSFSMATAEAKTLGLLGASTSSDGTFFFGTGFSYTLDPANRAVSGKYDFIGIAFHEFTEIMGRIPGLNQDGGGYLPYDLFRFTGPGVRNLTAGNNIYFSVNNGVTNLKAFNFPNGNGSDPQDWASGTNDACNAFSNSGVQNNFSQVDVTAMDVIGYTPAGATPLFTTTTSNGQVTITGYSGSSSAVVIPSTLNGLPVVGIGPDAFAGSGLTSVTIPGSVTTIGAGAFSGCASLASAIFQGNAPTMGLGVFLGTASTFTVYYYTGATGFTSPTWTDSSGDKYPAVNLATNPSQFTTTVFNGQVTITGYLGTGTVVTIPSTINSLPVVGIGVGAFQGNTTLTSITFPASITTIGGSAFSGCSSLATALFLGNAPTMGLSVFSGTAGNFSVYYYNGATGFTSPTWKDSSGDSYPATNLGTTGVQFKYTTTNSQITITGYLGTFGVVVVPDTINSLPVVGIAAGAFQNNTKITSVTLGANVLSIGNYALACPNLASVTLPAGLTSIGAYAFYGAKLTSVVIPDSVTTVGNEAFGGCTSLTNVTVGAGVTSLGSYGFTGCSGLLAINVSSANTVYSSVGGVLFNQNQTTLIEYPHGLAGSYTVPGTVTSIDSEALSSSPNLTSVTIPSSVTSIGAQAFQYDSSLTSALFQGNAPTMGQAVFHLAGNGFTVSYAGGATGFTSPTWTDSAGDTYPAINVSISDLFGGTVSGAGVKRSPWFGHYLYGSYPLVYQYNLGYEYAYAGPNGGVYLYDYTSGHFWYTQSGYFPFVYDFTLNCYLYYYAGNGSPRYFYKFSAINPGVITL